MHNGLYFQTFFRNEGWGDVSDLNEGEQEHMIDLISAGGFTLKKFSVSFVYGLQLSLLREQTWMNALLKSLKIEERLSFQFGTICAK